MQIQNKTGAFNHGKHIRLNVKSKNIKQRFRCDPVVIVEWISLSVS